MSPSAIALWFALMDTANKAGWPSDFSVAISTLRSKSGCGKDALYIARNQLKQKGRIDFKDGKGNQSAVYRLIPLVSEIQTQQNFASGNPTQVPTQPPTQMPTQTPNIIRIDKTREEIISDGVDARGREEETEVTPEYLFSQYFGGTPAPAEREHCTRWLVKHGAELVEQAFNTACMAGQKNLAYVRGIFNRYEARDIHDLGDVAADDLRHVHQARR